jgi:hypothetical protein
MICIFMENVEGGTNEVRRKYKGELSMSPVKKPLAEFRKETSAQLSEKNYVKKPLITINHQKNYSNTHRNVNFERLNAL